MRRVSPVKSLKSVNGNLAVSASMKTCWRGLYNSRSNKKYTKTLSVPLSSLVASVTCVGVSTGCTLVISVVHNVCTATCYSIHGG